MVFVIVLGNFSENDMCIFFFCNNIVLKIKLSCCCRKLCEMRVLV